MFFFHISIMGHFVHSFAEEVSATSLNDLQTTSLEWVTNAMSLQQLRKGKFIFFSSNRVATIFGAGQKNW